MLRRVKNSNSLSNVYDVEFYDYEKVFNTFPTEEEEVVVEDVHIIYDGGGVKSIKEGEC
jgi:hypothetical protein